VQVLMDESVIAHERQLQKMIRHYEHDRLIVVTKLKHLAKEEKEIKFYMEQIQTANELGRKSFSRSNFKIGELEKL